jgi:type IV pilus assembly protein PilB
MPTQEIGNILVARGYITTEQLDAALEAQHALPHTHGVEDTLVRMGYLSERDKLRCRAEQWGVEFIDLESEEADPEVLRLVGQELCRRYKAIPVRRSRGRILVAMREPNDIYAIDNLRLMLGEDVEPLLADEEDILAFIARCYGSDRSALDAVQSVIQDIDLDSLDVSVAEQGDGEEFTTEQMRELVEEAPVVRLSNLLLTQAAKDGASDIHIEPGDRCLRVRNRIDGKLYKSLEVPQNLLGAVTSRIKIMASLDISERRLPQDGRVHVLLEGRKIDLRVSTFPGNRGEKTVIRVLDTKSVSLNLRDLGFAEDVLAPLTAAIQAPNGIILVTGPTGSGKSTTLYAALNEISSMENNCCTVEDPIEYHLPLINQFQVQERVGLTFSKALRTLLRQDPDVIMVGEIRDEETARTAIQASLTGHLVLSTLHTNDSPSAITRLVNMGVEPYLIGAALNVVLAQRLVRRICPKCKEEFEPARTLRKAIERMGFGIEKYYRGIGCRKCRNTGYSGRLGVHELLHIFDELRDAIVAGRSVADLRRIGERYGMVTLRHDGFRKVREGLTSVEEVIQICGDITDASDRKAAPAAEMATA